MRFTHSALLLYDYYFVALLNFTGICLIRINMHLQRKTVIHSDLDIIEYGPSLIICLN